MTRHICGGRERGRGRRERPSEKNLSWKQLGYSEHASKGGREGERTGRVSSRNGTHIVLYSVFRMRRPKQKVEGERLRRRRRRGMKKDIECRINHGPEISAKTLKGRHWKRR